MILNLYKVVKALLFKKLKFEIDLIPFEFKKLSPKKIFNWILTESSVLFKPTQPFGFPTILQLEPTTECNLRCKICPVGIGMDRSTGHMDWELFRKIIDEMENYLLLILFWDWGEPFLNIALYLSVHVYLCYLLLPSVKAMLNLTSNRIGVHFD